MAELKSTAKRSTRYPFIAGHRGGPLTKENHQRLIGCARACSEHAIALIGGDIDSRLIDALTIAKKWESGKVSTGEAMKASLYAHAAARETKDSALKALARSVGQAVATAHMADHSLGAAFYALKAVKLANLKVAKEREWQDRKLAGLPKEIVEIVRAMWTKKELDKRI